MRERRKKMEQHGGKKNRGAGAIFKIASGAIKRRRRKEEGELNIFFFMQYVH